MNICGTNKVGLSISEMQGYYTIQSFSRLRSIRRPKIVQKPFHVRDTKCAQITSCNFHIILRSVTILREKLGKKAWDIINSKISLLNINKKRDIKCRKPNL